jgi:hypothetical protein
VDGADRAQLVEPVEQALSVDVQRHGRGRYRARSWPVSRPSAGSSYAPE